MKDRDTKLIEKWIESLKEAKEYLKKEYNINERRC